MAVPDGRGNASSANQRLHGRRLLFGPAPTEALNRGLQSAATARREYWRASDASPKSLHLGSGEPSRATSRRRMACCSFVQFPWRRSRSNWSCGLKTRVGQGKLRARRELPPCNPTTYNGSEAKLKANRGLAVSDDTVALQGCRTASTWWSCCRFNQ